MSLLKTNCMAPLSYKKAGKSSYHVPRKKKCEMEFWMHGIVSATTDPSGY